MIRAERHEWLKKPGTYIFEIESYYRRGDSITTTARVLVGPEAGLIIERPFQLVGEKVKWIAALAAALDQPDVDHFDDVELSHAICRRPFSAEVIASPPVPKRTDPSVMLTFYNLINFRSLTEDERATLDRAGYQSRPPRISACRPDPRR